MSATVHVPAWKRLGLKLKSAFDRTPQNVPRVEKPPIQEIDLHPRTATKKRSRDDEPDYQTPKRAKYSKQQHSQDENDVPVQSGNDRFIGSIYKNKLAGGPTKTPKKITFDDNGSVTTPSIAQDKSLARKKSVTFTPETKAEDGQSGQDFSKAWLSPKSDKNLTIGQTPESPSRSAAQTVEQTEDSAKPAKKKTAKASKKSSTAAGPRSACIAYLEQYANDRTNWKFNKARQNDLLRHIWDTKEIPSSLNEALLQYIQGLQSPAPRVRLREQAIEILDKLVDSQRGELGEVTMENEEYRRAAHERAIAKQLEIIERFGLNEQEENDLAQAQADLEKAQRAEILLWRSLWQYNNPGQPDPLAALKLPEEKAIAAPISRKSRKTRTIEIESDSSSDSSSDETDSSEDSSEAESSESESESSEDSSDSDDN